MSEEQEVVAQENQDVLAGQEPAGKAAGEPVATPPKTGQEPAGTGDSTDKNYIAELRREAAKWRKRLREVEAEAGQKSQDYEVRLAEAQEQVATLQAKLAEAEMKAQENALRASVVDAAARVGFADPADAYALLPMAEIEFDDDGRPQNVEDLLAALLEKKPYLRGWGAPLGGPTNPSRAEGGGQMSELARRLIEASRRGPPF